MSPLSKLKRRPVTETWFVPMFYLPRNSAGPFPVLLGASPYQKSLRHLPPVPAKFPLIEYVPMQLYLDEGYAYVAVDIPDMDRSKRVSDPSSCPQ